MHGVQSKTIHRTDTPQQTHNNSTQRQHTASNTTQQHADSTQQRTLPPAVSCPQSSSFSWYAELSDVCVCHCVCVCVCGVCVYAWALHVSFCTAGCQLRSVKQRRRNVNSCCLSC